MLEASGALVYVNEPMNPQHPPGRSPGCCGPTSSTPSSTSARRTSGYGCRRSGTRCGCASTRWPRCAATTAPTTWFGPSSTPPGSGLAGCAGAGPCSTTRTRCSRPRGCSAGSAARWWSRSATRWPPCPAGGGSAGRRGWPSCWPSRPWSATAWSGSCPSWRRPWPPTARRGRAGQPAVAGHLRDGGRLPPGAAAWRWSGTRTCRPTRCRRSRRCTAGSACPSGPTPSGPSWPRPRPGRAAGRCAGRCRAAGCPRRPPAAWTAGPTSRCGASASPPRRWPASASSPPTSPEWFGYTSGNGSR